MQQGRDCGRRRGGILGRVTGPATPSPGASRRSPATEELALCVAPVTWRTATTHVRSTSRPWAAAGAAWAESSSAPGADRPAVRRPRLRVPRPVGQPPPALRAAAGL